MLSVLEIERFLRYVLIGDGCWLWTGATHSGRGGLGRGGDSGPYGRFRFRGKNVGAHRIAWMIDSGRDVPSGIVVRHTCDVTLCVKPCHLILGTQLDNVLDMCARGRRNDDSRRGSLGSQARMLTIEGRSQAIIEWATEFGVNRTTVSERLRAGWSESDAVLTPVRKIRGRQ